MKSRGAHEIVLTTETGRCIRLEGLHQHDEEISLNSEESFLCFSSELPEMSYLYSDKWQPALCNHRHTGCLRTPHSAALFHVLLSPAPRGMIQKCHWEILHPIHCVGGVAKLLCFNTSAKCVSQENENSHRSPSPHFSFPDAMFRSDR